MDMYAMGVAATAVTMENTAGAAAGSQAPAGEVSFAQLLQGATGMGSVSADGQVDFSGLSWREIQSGMMLQAMGDMQNAENPVVTDPVLRGLLDMVKALSGDGQDGLAGGKLVQMIQLVEQMQERVQEILDENGAAVAGQELLALMGAMLPMLAGQEMAQPTMEALGADGGQALLALVQSSSPAELLRVLNAMPAQYSEATTAYTSPAAYSEWTQATEPHSAQRPNATASTLPGPLPGTQTEGGSLAGAAAVTVAATATGATTAAAGPNTAQEVQENFEAAVRQAKEQLGLEEAPAKPSINVDELQEQVDAGTFLRNTPLAAETSISLPEAEAEAEAPKAPVMQLAEPIRLAAADGEGQITIKLMPENLGEVTIRLTSTDEGMRLAIVARNPETQTLLAGQLDTLRQNLQPLNVEVESVMSQQQYELLNQQEQFSRQQQNSGQALRGAVYYGDDAPNEAQAVAAPARAATPNAVLDTRI